MDCMKNDSRSGLATVVPPPKHRVTTRKCNRNIFKLTAAPRMAQYILLQMTFNRYKQSKIALLFCVNNYDKRTQCLRCRSNS